MQNGNTLTSIFSHEKINNRTLEDIIYQPLVFNYLTTLRPGELINFVFNSQHQLQKLSLPLGKKAELTISLINKKYTPIIYENHRFIKTLTVHGTIEHSLFQSMQNLGLNKHLIMQFIGIFSNSINLSTEIHKGDKFSLIYAATEQNHKLLSARLLEASLTLKNHTYTAILYDDGFYNPEGGNWAKAFLRVPLKYIYISSPFSLRRYHPILHCYRAHEGVDLAANTGTPVHASSNGTIVFAGKEPGYGNVIILKYNHEYSTRYAHLSGFAKNIKKGVHVKEGQLIGYVGMTGLATGPHLHYEFRIDGKAVNPMTVNLPSAPGLYGKDKSLFENYIDHLSHSDIALSRK